VRSEPFLIHDLAPAEQVQEFIGACRRRHRPPLAGEIRPVPPQPSTIPFTVRGRKGTAPFPLRSACGNFPAPRAPSSPRESVTVPPPLCKRMLGVFHKFRLAGEPEALDIGEGPVSMEACDCASARPPLCPIPSPRMSTPTPRAAAR